MSQTRWLISSDSISETAFNAGWSGLLTKERVDNGYYFDTTLDGELTFTGDEYTAIFEVPDCELITCKLEEFCNDEWTQLFEGTFTTYDVKFDKDICRASVKPKPIDEYGCMKENWETDIVVGLVTPVAACRPFGGEYQSGYQCCTELLAPGEGDPDTPVCVTPTGWCFDKSFYQNVVDSFGNEVWMSCFHRIVAEGTAIDPPPFGTGWTLLSGTTWWRCPDGTDISFGELDNGRFFNDVIEYLFDQLGCGLTVKSHFFGINADHAAPPSNVAYDFATAFCQALQLHQKSDVKRPDATNPAQSFVWKMSLKSCWKIWQQ